MGVDDIVEFLAITLDLFTNKWFWIAIGILAFFLIIKLFIRV
jgi:hypothetical protein